MKVLGVQPSGVQNLVLSLAQLQEALRYFAPFENDGKSHANVDVLKAAAASWRPRRPVRPRPWSPPSFSRTSTRRASRTAP
jgi:hypothetical protein